MNKMLRLTMYATTILTLVLASFFLGHSQPNFLARLGVHDVQARALDYRTTLSSSNFGLLYEVRDLLEDNYVEKLGKEEQEDLVYASIRGMLRGVGDQYTRFMDPSGYKNMTIETKGKFGGVGILIGIRRHQLTVISPLEDTPAFRAGLKSGDIIIKIDDVSTEDMALDDAVARIRGDEGDKVVLTIWRRGLDAKGMDVEIIRAIIKLKSISKSEMLEDDIAYVKLTAFTGTSAENLKKHLLDFKKKKARGLILDLRNNPGGLLDASVEVANLFMGEGPIVHREGRNRKGMTYYARSGKKVWDGPMVVLVNEFSASASEIVSGALQDDGIATIIGETTFGKGLVQTVYPLSNGAAVLITTDKYLTSKRRDINKKGIVPDIIVKKGLVDAHEGGESEDDALAPDKVGKFPIGEMEVKKGDGTVVFNGLPRTDVPFYVYDGKKYLEVDDLPKIFGVAMKYDKETNTLDIEEDAADLADDDEEDPQLEKAIEVLKQKIAKNE